MNLMKKRAISPVIATVLLIGLVVAAAALVFFVVMPMLQPSGTALVTYNTGSYTSDGTNATFSFNVQASGADITIIEVTSNNGTIVISELEIGNGQTKTLTVSTGDTQYVSGTSYTFTIKFEYGESEGQTSLTVQL